jgi:hypothetical protein
VDPADDAVHDDAVHDDAVHDDAVHDDAVHDDDSVGAAAEPGGHEELQ